MLLTVTTTHCPATDLGFLLHKHPGRVQSFGVASGTAHVFYPEASGERCTAAFLLEVDPVALVRGPGDSVTHYVNDRPYAASSLLAVALKSVFGTALAGRCETAEAGRPVPLALQRRQAVLGALRAAGARSVADLGCGEGTLTGDLLRDSAFTRVIATDVSARALRQAARRLRLDRMPEARQARLTMFQSSLTYRDTRLAGLDAAVLMEVIEHVELDRLGALERAVFGFAAPRTVVVTTPNSAYNPEYGMADGTLRHRDHRFEWDRGQFTAWANQVGAVYGYAVRFAGVGRESATAGPPTQLAVFAKAEGGAA